MIWLLAATLETAAPALDASSATVELFRDACEKGELRLPPDRAKLAKRADVSGGYLDAFGWERAAEDTSYIQIMQPGNTYLFIEHPTAKESIPFSVICHLSTRNLSSTDGDRAFIGALNDPDVSLAWGDQFYPRYTIDRPADGYRKRLRRVGNYTYIDVAIYRTPTQSSASKGTP